MSTRIISQLGLLLSFIGLVLPPCGQAAPNVEVTVEITFNDWGYEALDDNNNLLTRKKPPGSLSGASQTRRCVVGLTNWMIESLILDDLTTNWFTGTNIVEYTVNTNDTAGGTSFPAVTRRRATVHASTDGNPETARIVGLDVTSRVCWLAFCSGPCFKNPDHKIYPPGPFWVESSVSDGKWTEWSKLFVDDLGLPQGIQLYSTNKQTVFEYHAHDATNFLGWHFPRTFYGIQYIDSPGRGWTVDLSFKGRITSIRETSEPQIPAEVLKAIH